MTAYYNEIDPYAAEWLKNLIAAGHIAPGIVDSRSIEDVRPDDLFEFTQCHFFAGIGVWSYALRLAGWPDDRPVWTGSCPCQPFSAAGKGDGFDDERHLWPSWFHLIGERKPPVIFGEQVEAAIKHGWLDLVQADMEGIGYAFAAAGIPAAGVGAPHIRQRLFFVADANGGRGKDGAEHARSVSIKDGGSSQLGNNNNNKGLEGQRRGHQAESGRNGTVQPVAEAGEFGGVEHANSQRLGEEGDPSAGQRTPVGCASSGMDSAGGIGWGARRNDDTQHDGQQFDATYNADRPGPTNGFWRDADWLFCRDGKWRPVEPGTFPLAHGAPARVGRLRAYGNAIVPQVAAEMIRAFMECRP